MEINSGSLPRNPFPAEAVAAYGKEQTTCEDLEYMARLGKELTDYLRSHPSERRYGAAVGLCGAHGSGKTHILNWLTELAGRSQKIRSTVLYTKCDSDSFFDLYRQATREHFDRDTLIDIIQLALLNLARAKVREAAVTQDLVLLLQSAGALQKLQAESNIALEQLRQQLLQELRDGGAPIEMARVILEVPNPKTGDNAHRWLTANEISLNGLESLGVSYQLNAVSRAPNTEQVAPAESGKLPESAIPEVRMPSAATVVPGTDRPDPGTAAITALSALATLHRVAGVPLIILIDQLEVLMRVTDGAKVQSQISLLKKFVEELSNRAALVFIAGIPEPWKRLPRDVSPRFRGRAETVVGSLTHQETHLLLASYAGELRNALFEWDIEGRIRDVCGGNPRETLRIAHALYEDTDGNTPAVTATAVLSAAQSAGTVEDRAVQALAALDSILPEFAGRVAKELLLPDDLRIDRALLSESGGPALLFQIAKATDALAEIDSARRVPALRRSLRDHWARASLVVISVGYSSREVRELFGQGVVLVAYNEKSFEAELRAQVVALLNERATSKTSLPTAGEPLDSKLDVIADRLLALEANRVAEQQAANTAFSQNAAASAAPAIEQRKLETRREVLDALTGLRDRLTEKNPMGEQQVMRSILIANEAYIKNRELEDLGEAYLEAISVERASPYSDDMLRDLRRGLIGDMSQTVRRPGIVTILANIRGRLVLAAVGLLCASFGTWLFCATVDVPSRPLRELLSMLPPTFIVLAGTVLYGLLFSWNLDRRRSKRLRSRLDEVYSHKRAEPAGESLRDHYPQAPR